MQDQPQDPKPNELVQPTNPPPMHTDLTPPDQNLIAIPVEQVDAAVHLAIGDSSQRTLHALIGTTLYDRASDASRHLLEAFVACTAARHQCVPHEEGSHMLVFRPRNFAVIDYAGRSECTLTLSLWGRDALYRQAGLSGILVPPRTGYARVRVTRFVDLPKLIHAADLAWDIWDDSNHM
jgi:hypothetical protein